MRETGKSIVIIFLLTMVISLEKIFGLPLFFCVGVMVLTARLSLQGKNMVAVVLGLVLAVMYQVPFWLGIMLLAGQVCLFWNLERITPSVNRRLLLSVVVSNLLLAIWLRLTPTLQVVGYHFVSVTVLTIILYLVQGWRYGPSLLGVSRRNVGISG